LNEVREEYGKMSEHPDNQPRDRERLVAVKNSQVECCSIEFGEVLRDLERNLGRDVGKKYITRDMVRALKLS
jgi:hypothetical protein